MRPYYIYFDRSNRPTDLLHSELEPQEHIAFYVNDGHVFYDDKFTIELLKLFPSEEVVVWGPYFPETTAEEIETRMDLKSETSSSGLLYHFRFDAELLRRFFDVIDGIDLWDPVFVGCTSSSKRASIAELITDANKPLKFDKHIEYFDLMILRNYDPLGIYFFATSPDQFELFRTIMFERLKGIERRIPHES